MPFGRRAARAWSHMRFWGPVVAVGLAVALVALDPAPLLPIARAYAALCARYPPVALAMHHVPPLPVALFLSLTGTSLLSGVWTGTVGLVATLRFHRRLRQAVEPVPARVAAIVEDLGLAARMTYVSWTEPMACCYGFLRPGIAITAGLAARLDDEELTAVLGHEREHVRQRDPLRYLLLDALAAAAFMLPLVPALRQRWRTQTELAADRAALAVASRGALAGALLAVIRSAPAPAGVAGLTATEARIAQLGGELILPPIPARTVLASLGLAAAVIVAFAALTASADLVRMTCPFCPVVP